MDTLEKEQIVGSAITGGVVFLALYWFMMSFRISELEQATHYNPLLTTLLRIYYFASFTTGALLGLAIAVFRFGYLFSLVTGVLAGILMPVIVTVIFDLVMGFPLVTRASLEKYGGVLGLIETMAMAGIFYLAIGALAALASKAYLNCTIADSTARDAEAPPPPPEF